MKKLQSFQNNQKNREEFNRFWAEYVLTHSDEVWSKQQAILINSMLQSAQQETAKRIYLRKVRNELR